MSHHTHSTVGQNAGRCVVPRARAGARVPSRSDGRPPCSIAPIEGGVSQSPVTSHRSPRRGISLTEVLIAMGILTVGLLGVAAIFPVAGFYMQKGEVADRGSAIAQAAFNELITRGMLNPESWIVMVPTSNNQPNQTFNVDNKGNPNSLDRGSFTRPFAAAVREAQSRIPAWKGNDYAGNFGGGFVIDPLGVGAFAGIPGEVNLLANRIAMPFPSSFVWWFPNPTSGYPWSPWSGRYNSPLRRVTFRDARTGLQLSDAMADRLFRASDDLSLEMPVGQDKPSKQSIDLGDIDGDGKANEPLTRQSRGGYSWLATVVPSTPEGLVALANGPAGNTYEVSVVVFYKRNLPTSLPTNATTDADNVAAEERMAAARIVSTGLSGGEILLQRHPRDPASITESPFENLKTGRWIVLCGPHPSSTDARPLFVARWYKVLSIEKETNGIITDPAIQRLVTVRGPQWPWQPSTNAGDVSNNLCVGIIPGAVAVHAKTIRIEGSSVWTGGAEGLNTSPVRPQTALR